MRNLSLILVIWMAGIFSAKSQVVISSFADIDSLVQRKSYVVKNGSVELDKAKKAKLAGMLGIPDPTGNLSLGYTNNTQLPVTVFPAEVLGGTPGTYEKVILGTRYNSNFTSYVDLKIINVSGIKNFKLSKTNIRIVETDNTIRLRDLYQNAAIVYYNILTLQAQRNATEQYVDNAERLLTTVSNKLDNGLASPQEVNDARITKLTQEENLRQIDFQIQQQLNSLKTLIDISETEQVVVSGEEALRMAESVEPIDSRINRQKAMLEYEFSKTRLEKERSAFLPTLSFVMNYQSQWFDIQPNLFSSSQSWIPSNYYGLRLTMPLPGANQIGAFHDQKFQMRKSQLSTEQAAIKDELEVSKLKTDLEKARSEYNSSLEIASLRKQNYGRNLLNYDAGLVTLEYTINSFNALVDADYSVIAARKRLSLQKQLIMINNTIK